VEFFLEKFLLTGLTDDVCCSDMIPSESVLFFLENDRFSVFLGRSAADPSNVLVSMVMKVFVPSSDVGLGDISAPSNVFVQTVKV
jgi:hypothetical protein